MTSLVLDVLRLLEVRLTMPQIREARRFDDFTAWWDQLDDPGMLAEVLVRSGIPFDEVIAPLLDACEGYVHLRAQIDRELMWKTPEMAYNAPHLFSRFSGVELSVLCDVYRDLYPAEAVSAMILSRV